MGSSKQNSRTDLSRSTGGILLPKRVLVKATLHSFVQDF